MNKFIIIIGGSASGKNFIFNKRYKNDYSLIDIDSISRELNNGIINSRDNFSAVIKETNKRLLFNFRNKVNTVQVTTGSNKQTVLNKIKLGNDFNFDVHLILVKSKLSTLQNRNIERSTLGDQLLVPGWKVEKTFNNSMKVYNEICYNNNLKSHEVIINE